MSSPPGGEPPHGYYLLDPEHPLPTGYGYIQWVKADGSFPTWGEISFARKPKARWVGPTFLGDWAPGLVQFGGKRRASTMRKRKGKKRTSRRRR